VTIIAICYTGARAVLCAAPLLRQPGLSKAAALTACGEPVIDGGMSTL